MTGYMNQRFKATHFQVLINTGGKYLEPFTVCGWIYPKKSTFDIKKVTCPDCLARIESAE